MAKINLRNIYPYYKQDYFIEVSDEVAEALFHFERSSHAHERKIRRHKAYYSLDRADGIEKDIVFLMRSPEEVYEHKMTKRELHFAMATLPEKQARRIYAHFFLKKSVAEIAREEGVSWTSVDRGIRQGLARIGEILEKS